VAVPQAETLRVEQGIVARSFHGSLRLYLRTLAQHRATRAVARGVIADELRRRLISASLTAQAPGQPPLTWSADVEAAAVDAATCRRDDLPGSGDFPASNAREIGVVPLPALLPFLFADTAPPAPPAGLAATPAPGGVTLDWRDSPEADAVGYVVYRSAVAGGPYVRLTQAPLTRSLFVDVPPAGAAAYYVVRAVDTSRNRSDASAEVAATPG
jgi:hypothetical protein